jgi:hypothetical protein
MVYYPYSPNKKPLAQPEGDRRTRWEVPPTGIMGPS